MASRRFSLRITYGADGGHCDGAPITLLAASSDAEISGARSLGGGLFELTLTAKSERQDCLTLTLTGCQRTGAEVYLYCAEGGRTASQRFVGSQPDSETSLRQTFCYYKTAYSESRAEPRG